MDIRGALQSEHSKAVTMRIVEYVGDDPIRFGAVAEIVMGDDPLLSQRGAWVISHCAAHSQAAVLPSLLKLLEYVRDASDLHDAIKRNTMKAAAIMEIPDSFAGLAADLAFSLLRSSAEPIAVKVYSMEVLFRLGIREPSLAEELRLCLAQPIAGNETPAFRAKVRSISKELDKCAQSCRE